MHVVAPRPFPASFSLVVVSQWTQHKHTHSFKWAVSVTGGTEIEWDDGRINGVLKQACVLRTPVFSQLLQEEVLLSLARNRQTDESENNRQTYMFNKKLGQSFRLSYTFLQLTQEITEDKITH